MLLKVSSCQDITLLDIYREKRKRRRRKTNSKPSEKSQSRPIPLHTFLSHLCLVGFCLMGRVKSICSSWWETPLICQSRCWLLNARQCLQSQAPCRFSGLRALLLPHFKRRHVKELLVLHFIHLYK